MRELVLMLKTHGLDYFSQLATRHHCMRKQCRQPEIKLFILPRSLQQEVQIHFQISLLWIANVSTMLSSPASRKYVQA